MEIYELGFMGLHDENEGLTIGRPVGRMPPKSRLRSGKSIRPVSEDIRENQRALEGTPALAVAFTCRQIYLEAAPIYHKAITWQFRSWQWMKRFLETLGFKNKIQGVGLRVLEAVQHIRIVVRLPRMMALAAKFPHLKSLDILSWSAYKRERYLLMRLRETVPATFPLQMPMLETVNYGSVAWDSS